MFTWRLSGCLSRSNMFFSLAWGKAASWLESFVRGPAPLSPCLSGELLGWSLFSTGENGRSLCWSPPVCHRRGRRAWPSSPVFPEQTQESIHRFEQQAGLSDAGYTPHKGLTTEETKYLRVAEALHVSLFLRNFGKKPSSFIVEMLRFRSWEVNQLS